MGNYNPHVPRILGEEWVPIRDEDVTFSPFLNSIEQGHSFALTTPRTLQSMRWYLNDPAASRIPPQVLLAAVYPKGMEAATGPIRRVLIPCNNGGLTGTGVSLSFASDVKSALGTADDLSAITFLESGVVLQKVGMYFAVNSYPELFNKRILAVNLRYVFGIDPKVLATSSQSSFINLISTNGTVNYGNLSDKQGPPIFDVDGTFLGTEMQYSSLRLGEINQLFDTTVANINRTTEQLPWTYEGLQRFEASATNRIDTVLTVQLNPTGNTDGTFAVFQYAALEVLFCEEQRLAMAGGKRCQSTSGSVNDNIFVGNGVQVQPARVVGSYALSPTLPPGDYTVTLSSPDLGDLLTTSTTFPKLNGLREYYPLTSHPGVRVNIPASIDETKVGEFFTQESLSILPQISLHTSGGPLTEVHAYGRQAIAQVFGTVTATQEILDSVVGSAQLWPQVRYYARRFGDTTVPLLLDSPTISGAGNSVQISPVEFDELPEIIDGWKEVTLRFSSPPTMGAGTTPQWRWSAAGEAAGNRWEVLGCMAPALTGLPGNYLNPVASPHQLSSATYGAPNAGSTVNFGWIPQYAPGVTATSDDQTSDGVLIFAQDMLPVTGLSVIQASQPVSGIGFDCGDEPCCIPSAIFYNSLTWSLPINTGVAADVFDRSVAAGSWGNADVGGAYTLSGTAGDFAVGTSNPPWDTDDQGVITFSANSSDRFAVLSIGAIDFDVMAEIQFLSTIASGSLRGGVVGRYTDASNTYLASLDVSSTGAVTLKIEKIVGGSVTTLASISMPNLSGGIGSTLVVRFTAYGTFIKAKAWAPDADEPDMWSLETTDSALTTGSFAGIFGRDESAVTGHIIAYDNLSVGPPRYWFGFYELQRQDSLTDWQTIMMATDPATVSFKDYEARVGVQSDYRIRAVDPYQFAGPWSSTVSETVDDPGIVIGCEGGHILIFTSNSEQDGSVNLAYSSVFERDVNEDFEFVEAQDVVLQKMYGKDFVTAFRPLERGGERFIRTVLVQAAAISPPTLGDFTSLRDMAWDSVPYICVRDEDGNRWFATVIVPSGRVQLNRTLYMAPVTVQEVTDTAYPVDP